MKQKPFSSIDTFIKEHVRSVLEESDYQGKDEQENPIYEHLQPYPVILGITQKDYESPVKRYCADYLKTKI